MNDVKKPLCIIPARGSSKRLQRKNIALLAGKPLLAYAIEAAIKSGLFAKVLVSTEDKEIACVASKYGAEIHERNRDLASDTASVMDVCCNILEQHEQNEEFFDEICVLLPTSPLRTTDDIKNAYAKFKTTQAHGLMAVTTYEISPFLALKEDNGFLVPYFGRQYIKKSQDLPQVVVDNGAIYFLKTEILEKERTFYCSKLIGFNMPRERSIDVDEESDLKLAECFLLFRQKEK